MNVSSTISKILAGALALTLCGTPELAAAQQSTTQPQPQTSTIAPAAQAQQSTTDAQTPTAAPQNQQSPTNGVKVDPAAGPQEPTPGEAKPPVETSPNAANEPAATDQQQQAAPEAPSAVHQRSQQPTIKENPVGTAVAEKANTRGGAASKPAGAAIAPAKQKQTRGLFLKYGAVIAAGAALGTVYALTRGTSSVPPGTAH